VNRGPGLVLQTRRPVDISGRSFGPAFFTYTPMLMKLFGRASREERFWQWFQAQSDRLFDFEADQDRVFKEPLRGRSIGT